MAIMMGESTYKDCERPGAHATFPNATVSCPFQGGKFSGPLPYEQWCRACLIAKIESLKRDLEGIGARAAAAAVGHH